MKYETKIIIDAPIGKTSQHFSNPDNYKKWMNGLQKFEVVVGDFGEEGTISNYYFKQGKRDMFMRETVLISNLPYQYKVQYEAENVLNYVDNRMEATDEDHTLYTVEHEFIFSSFMKMMGLIMPGAFKKQSKKYLMDFKQFVETSDQEELVLI